MHPVCPARTGILLLMFAYILVLSDPFLNTWSFEKDSFPARKPPKSAKFPTGAASQFQRGKIYAMGWSIQKILMKLLKSRLVV